MVFAADYPLLNILWTMLVFFGFVIWFWLLIRVFGTSSARRHWRLGEVLGPSS